MDSGALVLAQKHWLMPLSLGLLVLLQAYVHIRMLSHWWSAVAFYMVADTQKSMMYWCLCILLCPHDRTGQV